MKKIVFLLLMVSNAALAIELKSVAKKDLVAIVEETGATYKHTVVNSGSVTEKVFGYEIGLMSGSASTPQINSLLNNESSSGETKSIPRFSLIGALQLPLNLSAELNYQPEIRSSFRLSSQSVGLKWNTKAVKAMPVDLAVKGFLGRAEIGWTQAFNTNIDYSQNYYGVDLLVSRKYGFLEPYANVGYISNEGKLGSNKLSPFDAGYTTSTSAKEKVDGFTYGLGMEVNLLMMSYAFEMQSSFNTTAVAFKAAADF